MWIDLSIIEIVGCEKHQNPQVHPLCTDLVERVVIRCEDITSFAISGTTVRAGARLLASTTPRLGHINNLGEYTPQALVEQLEIVAGALQGKKQVLIHDGTPRIRRHWFTVVGRFLDDDFNPIQLKLGFTSSRSIHNAIIIGLMTNDILGRVGVQPSQVVGLSHDSVSANQNFHYISCAGDDEGPEKEEGGVEECRRWGGRRDEEMWVASGLR